MGWLDYMAGKEPDDLLAGFEDKGAQAAPQPQPAEAAKPEEAKPQPAEAPRKAGIYGDDWARFAGEA